MTTHFESPPQNPFVRPMGIPPSPEGPAVRYAETVTKLARQFVYDEGDLDVAKIEREIRRARSIREFNVCEEKNHELELLLYLLKGIEAHERANTYHTGAWQAALIHQGSRQPAAPKAPETLTRQEVTREFESFDLKQELLAAEQATLTQYQQFLALNAGATIRLSQNISIDRTDIEVLVIDIKARMIERLAHDGERRAAIQALDRELAEIIDRIPAEHLGKAFELKEIYLLRRLIHAADTGHLASVSHGTPRQDLRIDRGSVDIEITAAGEVLQLQLKTFKYGVASHTREKQARIHAIAAERLQDSSTYLTVLTAEDVQKAYEASRRQLGGQRTSRADKYAALEPMAEDLHTNAGRRLLTLLGLTEEDLVREQEEFETKVMQRREFEVQLASQREDARRLAEEDRRRVEKEQAIEAVKRAAELARLQAIERHEQVVRDEVAQRQQTRIVAEQAKRQAAERRLAEAAEHEKTLRAEREAQAAAAALKEAQRLKREEKKREAPDWPPKNLVGICTAPLLKNIGLLPEAWKDDVRVFMAAKKKFFQLFANPKKGSADATDKDRPSELFVFAFPSKISLASPTAEDIARWRSLIA